ncbi:MAG TPA: hypothetical protein VLL54_02265 [Pyrinomonadaceae bacterium]|nr:hypothetical protein [Pyrinomonadaceae bacterium]
MKVVRVVLGITAGLSIVATGAMHSLVGWGQLKAVLANTQVPAEVLIGLQIPWHLAGVAMVTFGSITIALVVSFARGRKVSFLAIRFIAIAYVAFGSWALVAVKLDPFLMIFVVQGTMLLVVAWKPIRKQELC